jgi:hypothetical protein
MEFYKIVKIGGINNPFAYMEWPGIQIPHAILSILGTKGILYHFLDDKGAWEQSLVHFYERNPAGRGRDFDDAPEDKPNFTRYAVEIPCLNPLTDTKRSPLPPLEELADGGSHHTHYRRPTSAKGTKEGVGKSTTKRGYLERLVPGSQRTMQQGRKDQHTPMCGRCKDTGQNSRPRRGKHHGDIVQDNGGSNLGGATPDV